MSPTRRNSVQALLRESNLAMVLRCLHDDGPLSRAQLASHTELNKSTVSSLIDELLSLDLIREAGQDASGGGRPATLIELNPGAGQIIGLELGVDFILVVLADFAGNIVWRQAQDIQPNQDQERIIDQALQLVGQAIRENQAGSGRLMGIGLTLPGMVNVRRGTLLFSPNLQWYNVDLGRLFRQRTELPIFVENDANAAAVGEHFFGVARQTSNFVFVVAGVGVGGGLYLDGSLYRGAGGLAGEIGHTNFSVDRDRPCRCGSRGCWENSGNEDALKSRARALMEVGRPSLITRIMAQQNSPLTIGIITEAAKAGDEVALEALAETGSALGIGISNLINIFNPELIVLGGSLSQAGEFLLPAINAQVEKHALSQVRNQAQVTLSAFGPDAIVLGAVALVVEAILVRPNSVHDLTELTWAMP